MHICITGGTIDVDHINKDNVYCFDKTHIPDMIARGRYQDALTYHTLFLKDSAYMDDNDRKQLADYIAGCDDTHIIITHGTDTMTQSATALYNVEDKTIVFVGAMIPQFQDNSDALFNLGCAIGAAPLLSRDIYIAMHGTIFTATDVIKNKKRERFEPLNAKDI